MADNIMPMGPFKTRTVITITDNWYAVRTFRGRLISVGTWLPPECEGIEAQQVTHDEAFRLLAELSLRTYQRGPVGSFEAEE